MVSTQPVRTPPPTHDQSKALGRAAWALEVLSPQQRGALASVLGEVGSVLRITRGLPGSTMSLVLEPLAAAHAELMEVWAR